MNERVLKSLIDIQFAIEEIDSFFANRKNVLMNIPKTYS